jgi:hypothetical protein
VVGIAQEVVLGVDGVLRLILSLSVGVNGVSQSVYKLQNSHGSGRCVSFIYFLLGVLPKDVILHL